MTERQVHPRSSCVMPGCRRWSTRFEGDWICGEHWRLVPRDLKLLRTTLRRRWRRRWDKTRAIYEADQVKPTWRAWLRADAAWRRGEDGLWRRMKQAAIERAAGL